MKLAAKLDSLTEMDLLEKYLNGLDRDVREKIMLTHPEDLKDAQSKAMIYYNMSSSNTVSVNAITKPINHIPRRSNQQNRNYQQNNQQNSFRNNQQNNYRNNYKNNQTSLLKSASKSSLLVMVSQNLNIFAATIFKITPLEQTLAVKYILAILVSFYLYKFKIYFV